MRQYHFENFIFYLISQLNLGDTQLKKYRDMFFSYTIGTTCKYWSYNNQIEKVLFKEGEEILSQKNKNEVILFLPRAFVTKENNDVQKENVCYVRSRCCDCVGQSISGCLLGQLGLSYLSEFTSVVACGQVEAYRVSKQYLFNWLSNVELRKQVHNIPSLVKIGLMANYLLRLA